jgi:thiol-disulfide isomerase/thioredoxin
MKRIFLGLSALIFLALAGCNQDASNTTDNAAADNTASVPPKKMDSTKVVEAPENVTKPGKTALQAPKTPAKPVAPKTAKLTTKPLKVNWQPSLAAAFKEADKTGKPIMADFYAVWCGPCKILDEYVYPSADFAKVAQDWVVVKIDAEKETELAQKYQIQAFPTTIFFKPDGSIFEKQEGFAASSNDPASVGVEFRTQLVDMMKSYRDQAGRSRIANLSTHINSIS